MFDPSVFSIFDTLNQLFSVIGTVYVYATAIALPVCILQFAYVRYVNQNTVSDEFYQQVKVALAEDAMPEFDEVASFEVPLSEGVPFRAKARDDRSGISAVRVEPEQPSKPNETEIVRNFWTDIDQRSPASAFYKPRDGVVSDFERMNIRAIRDYVKAQSLQQVIKEAIGKTYSQCTLVELRSALSENQAIDRF